MTRSQSFAAAPTGPEDLFAAEDQAWRLLQRGVADRHAASRHPSLVTVDAEGRLQVRTVVLRRVEPEARVLGFHSDRRSQKVHALQALPSCAVHVYDSRRRLQLRVSGQAAVHLDGAAVDAEWQRLPPGSRDSYAVLAAPGSVVAHPTQGLERGDDAWARSQFCYITIAVQSIEALWLRPSGHLRAGFFYDPPAPSEWWVP